MNFMTVRNTVAIIMTPLAHTNIMLNIILFNRLFFIRNILLYFIIFSVCPSETVKEKNIQNRRDGIMYPLEEPYQPLQK